MSLDVAKLEKARELVGGIVQARCPACAEGGHDRSGEHLRVYPDGRFGCCVHPKDGEHRKRIWALVGVRKPGIFSLRLKTPPALPPAQSVKAVLTAFDLGTLGTGKSESKTGEHLRIYPDGRFGCCVHPKDGEHRKRIWALAGVRKPGIFALRLKTPPALPTVRSVKMALTAFDRGTLGTGKSESVFPVSHDSSQADLKISESGTLGTAIVELRARARVDSTTANIDRQDFHEQLEDLASPVPSVPSAVVLEPPVLPDGHHERLPYLTAGGTLVIPFDSPERYHWWMPDGERMSVAETLHEVKERMKNAIAV